MEIICSRLKDSLTYPKPWLEKVIKVNLSYLQHDVDAFLLLKIDKLVKSQRNLLIQIKECPDHKLIVNDKTFKLIEKSIFIYSNVRLNFLSKNETTPKLIDKYTESMLEYILATQESSRINDSNLIRRKVNDIDKVENVPNKTYLKIRYWFNIAYIYICDPTLLKDYYMKESHSLYNILQSYAKVKNDLRSKSLPKKRSKNDVAELTSEMIHATELANMSESKRLFLTMLNIQKIDGLNKNVLMKFKYIFIKIFIKPFNLTNISLQELLMELKSYNDNYLIPDLSINDILYAIKYLAKQAVMEETSENSYVSELNYKINNINKATHIDKLKDINEIDHNNDLRNIGNWNIKSWLGKLYNDVIYNLNDRFEDILNANHIAKILYPQNDFSLTYDYILDKLNYIFNNIVNSNNDIDSFFYQILFLNKIKKGPEVSLKKIREDILVLLWPKIYLANDNDVILGVKSRIKYDLRLIKFSLTNEEFINYIKNFFKYLVRDKDIDEANKIRQKIISVSIVNNVNSKTLDQIKDCININSQKRNIIKNSMLKISRLLGKDISIKFPKIMEKDLFLDNILSIFNDIAWNRNIAKAISTYDNIKQFDGINEMDKDSFNKIKINMKQCLAIIQKPNMSYKTQVNVVYNISQDTLPLFKKNAQVTLPYVLEIDDVVSKLRKLFENVIWEKNNYITKRIYNQIITVDKIDYINDNDLNKIKRYLKECLA